MSEPCIALRILFLIRAMTTGGAERQLINLSRGLSSRGHRVCVATYYGGGALEAELRVAGVEVYCLDKRGRWDLFAFFGRFRRLVRAIRPDVLYGFMPTENLTVMAARVFARHRARVVFGIRAADASGKAYGWAVRMAITLQRFVAPWADGVIANSSAGLTALGVSIEARRVVVIPNGIDVERFRPLPELRARARAAAGIDATSPCVGMVARLDPLKGHLCFLDAAHLLAAVQPEAHFLIVGDGPAQLRRAFEARAAALGIADRVHWQWGTPEPEVVYNAMDVCVSASESESFPNVIAEAMACGVPVVATDVGDSAAIVGLFGVCVAVGDAAAMAAGIDTLLSTGCAERSEQIRSFIVERYALAELAARTENFLCALVSGGSVRNETHPANLG